MIQQSAQISGDLASPVILDAQSNLSSVVKLPGAQIPNLTEEQKRIIADFKQKMVTLSPEEVVIFNSSQWPVYFNTK